MKFDQILSKMGVHSYNSYERVYGGKDSEVYKVEVGQGITYALRLLPSQRHDQFIHEKNMIDRAIAHNIPVPQIHKVIVFEKYSGMLMDWGSGQTIFQELQAHPENARKLGYEFGKVQVSINSISIPAFYKNSNSWLSPNFEEQEIVNKIPQDRLKSNLIHLDYHPLNVLTDGEKITAVIDWANATIGDYRFDIARTLSIFQLAGYKHFEKNLDVILDFEKGWKQGYGQVVGSLDLLESIELFNAWAGVRMKRDLAGELSRIDYVKIQDWAASWMKIYDESAGPSS
ncbi:aminoglycoside phosphotransferase (APT) family kinase protein [Bacillus pakistanensis]|uniref:Aminoglycoside phosphotransferase (APT) family kinase protein n=1 Tax=Rossellomorea pakistanensis TaxID=992288 RepID=A0ABS2NC99_9BACI|nr:aminoglycoside phosphotransferase family protein [Bacillus pakistanensis]MBM7585471.1 aminoglycoside phosphotransferase (APT) family kinase protein [Bacillus pakistanensis]